MKISVDKYIMIWYYLYRKRGKHMAKKIDKEKLIKSIMKRAELDGEPVTREEAEE